MNYFSRKYITPFNYSDQQLSKLGWSVSTDGDLRNMPFGLLRAVKNPHFNSHMQPIEGSDCAKAIDIDYDFAILNQAAPYFFIIYIMPPNFVEFW